MIYVPDHAVVSMNPLYGKDELVALYQNEYKIIVERQRGDMMIFNLASDPREYNDLYGKVELPIDIESRVNENKRRGSQSMLTRLKALRGAWPSRSSLK
jgi:hypothetical protein